MRSVRGTAMLLAGVLTLGLVGIAAYAAAQPAKPGVAIQVAPASQSITRGQQATFTVTATSAGGFSGPVTFSASGVPASAAASFSPSTVTLTASGTGSSASSTLTVTTTSSTPAGSYTLQITGTSGKISGTGSAGLTVNYPLSGSLSLAATPATVTVAPGRSAVYSLTLTRANLAGPVTFTATGVPAGATAAFTPNPTTGSSGSLQVGTSSSVATGTYPINLIASGTDSAGTTRYAYASVQLVISGSGKAFTISGNLTGQLGPGISLPLDLAMTNPNNQTLSVTNLTVTVQSVARTSYAVANNLACTVNDYAVRQYSGPYPLNVPGNGNLSLSGAGVARTAFPQVAMLDTNLNQDGCKGATLTLAYNGSGQGS